jgi:hypothetical protein
MWLRRFRAVTTNDNREAQAFYRRLGFDLVEVREEAVTKGRLIKPTIPLVSDDGTPITDEWVFERPLDGEDPERPELTDLPEYARSMEASTVWKFLHIASMFLAVSIFVGQGMLSGVVARSGDVAAVRRVMAAEERFAPIGGAAFLLGIVFGIVAAITIAYALALFIVINGATYHRRQSERLKAAAEAGPEDGRSEEIRAIAGAPITNVMNVIDALAWLAIIFVMVTKPFA